MLRLADGDRAAFTPMYELLWPFVHRFAARALPSTPEAEDAAQVALMKVFSNAASFDPDRDVVAWVLGITAYECKTLRKKQQRRRETSDHNGDERVALGRDADPEAAAIARDLELAALEVLESLSSADIETLRAVIEDRRPEIAAPTFRKRVSRAIERLRALWSTRHDLD